MNILFIHPNMPGQYKHLARAFGAEGAHRIFFITKHKSAEIPGVTRVTYTDAKPQLLQRPHRYLVTSNDAVLQGQQVWRACHALKMKEQFVPDIIVAHSGWGDALFLKDLFPAAKLLNYFEFYYHAQGADVGFENPMTDDDRARVRMKNITNLLSLEQADWGITPTQWQWTLHPAAFRSSISILHEGIDTDVCAPNTRACFITPNGTQFKPGDEVITYVARNLEPYRGFPTFMRTAVILLRERPHLHIVCVGNDDVSYGRKLANGQSYRSKLSQELSVPADRIHFIPKLPYAELLTLFQISAAHLYLTYPFVLSWSLLEAMACGVALVASDTGPVLDVVDDGRNGLLADFHSPEDVASKLSRLLDDPARNAGLRAAARQTIVEQFDLKKLLPLQMQLVREVASGQIPPPIATVLAAQQLKLLKRNDKHVEPLQ